MKKRWAIASALAWALFLILGAGRLKAEDSGVFKNPADIAKAQEILVENGYLAPESFTSGMLDASTRTAISSYQSEHALNERGDLDDETFQSLTSHEISYPWGEQEAESRVEPAEQPVPTIKVAQAPQVPEPTPAPTRVRQAPPVSPAPARHANQAVDARPARKMPATGSPLPMMLLAGLLLLGAGALVLRRRVA